MIINGAERFDFAGPVIDRGVKGKKDTSFTYGDRIGHTGGSAFGKDSTKVDFHGLVWGRYVSKNLVANNVASQVITKATYAIGQEEPLVIDFSAHDSELDKEGLVDLVTRNFPTARTKVLRELDLKQPWIYPETARVGFFGNKLFPWEQVKKLK